MVGKTVLSGSKGALAPKQAPTRRVHWFGTCELVHKMRISLVKDMWREEMWQVKGSRGCTSATKGRRELVVWESWNIEDFVDQTPVNLRVLKHFRIGTIRQLTPNFPIGWNLEIKNKIYVMWILWTSIYDKANTSLALVKVLPLTWEQDLYMESTNFEWFIRRVGVESKVRVE